MNARATVTERPPPRVLVIDDDTDGASSLALFLRLHGYRATAVCDGAEAIAHCAAQAVDAVICDLGLEPPHDGHAVARCLRARHGKALWLLAYSGSGTPADIARALDAGFDAHLIKPAAPTTLATLMHEGLQRKRNG